MKRGCSFHTKCLLNIVTRKRHFSDKQWAGLAAPPTKERGSVHHFISLQLVVGYWSPNQQSLFTMNKARAPSRCHSVWFLEPLLSNQNWHHGLFIFYLAANCCYLLLKLQAGGHTHTHIKNITPLCPRFPLQRLLLPPLPSQRRNNFDLPLCSVIQTGEVQQALIKPAF